MSCLVSLVNIIPANASTSLPRSATSCTFQSAGFLLVRFDSMPATSWTTSNFTFQVILNFASVSSNFLRYPFVWLQVSMSKNTGLVDYGTK